MNEEAQTELQALKEIASNMNLKLGNMKDIDKIKAAIAEAREPVVPKVATKAELRKALKAEKLKLVRIRITPMSPYERQLKGAQISVGNVLLGDIHRVIPFNSIQHVEQFVYENLRDRKYRDRIEKVNPSTQRKYFENIHLPTYGIEVLPPLTDKELVELAADQRSRQAID